MQIGELAECGECGQVDVLSSAGFCGVCLDRYRAEMESFISSPSVHGQPWTRECVEDVVVRSLEDMGPGMLGW